MSQVGIRARAFVQLTTVTLTDQCGYQMNTGKQQYSHACERGHSRSRSANRTR